MDRNRQLYGHWAGRREWQGERRRRLTAVDAIGLAQQLQSCSSASLFQSMFEAANWMKRSPSELPCLLRGGVCPKRWQPGSSSCSVAASMQFDEDAVQYLLFTEAQHLSMARTIVPRLAEAAGSEVEISYARTRCADYC